MNFDDASKRHGRITIDFDAEMMSDSRIEILSSWIDTLISGDGRADDMSYKINTKVYDPGHRRYRTLGKK